jgi:cytochrome c peroxidase
MKLAQNHDPHFFDMGICGPFRTDLKDQTQYCGMFLTPTLRNTATRHAFFHNGIYSNLDDVMAFYNARNTDPARFYPRGAGGKLEKYDDIPPAWRRTSTERCTVRPQVRRPARDDRSGYARYRRVPAYADGRLRRAALKRWLQKDACGTRKSWDQRR